MNKYKIVRKLGVGSFANVDLAVDKESKMPFAIKTLKQSITPKSKK